MPEEWNLNSIPSELVVRAQQDADFALRLLNRETRDAALDEAQLGLPDDQRNELSEILDEIASMSFQDAIRRLREQGLSILF
jgi:hypothetical protein